MRKKILKKIIQIPIIAIIILFVIALPSPKEMAVKGYDYGKSDEWDGSSLGITPHDLLPFVSEYVPFSNIISAPPTGVALNKIYVIESATDLYYLSFLTHQENKNIYLGLHYILGRNIDYNDAAAEGKLIYPIGFLSTAPFTGTFDGQGFVIKNLYFEPILTSEDFENRYKGDLEFYSLFSRVASGAVVKNVGIENIFMAQPIVWGNMIYASPLIGENHGTVTNVFVRDDRVEAGMSADGGFILSGLMSRNYGIFQNSYVAMNQVKTSAVISYVDEDILLNENHGTVSNIYYDKTLYIQTPNDPRGLVTSGFQIQFKNIDGWYVNTHYSATNPQARLNHIYPVLRGLDVVGTDLLIKSAVDLITFTELLTTSQYFRNANYYLVADLDMNEIARGEYQAVTVPFNGKLSSRQIDDPAHTTLYTHPTNKGAVGYYSIIGLTVDKATVVGINAYYGLLSTLTGKIENINLLNFKVTTTDISEHVGKTLTGVGLVTGQIDGGTISNVHVYGEIRIPDDKNIGKTYIGGLVGYGSGTITTTTTAGLIESGAHTYDERMNGNAVGGIVGNAVSITIKKSINKMSIYGIGYANFVTSNNTSLPKLYVGGVIGIGSTNEFSEVVNKGNVQSHKTGYVNRIYIGGIIGLHTGQIMVTSQINNDGNVTLNVNNLVRRVSSSNIERSRMNAKIAGIGNTFSESKMTYFALRNNGQLITTTPNTTTLASNTEKDIVLSDITAEAAGVMITTGTNASFQGLYNRQDMDVDMTIINYYAAVLLVNNMHLVNNQNNLESYDNISDKYGTSTEVVQSYNYGKINALTREVVSDLHIKISGNILGKNMDYDQIRNEGEIKIHFSHATTKLLKDASATADGIATPYKNLKVVGVLEEVSYDKFARNLYNGGNINISMTAALNVRFNLYISGIAYKNANTKLYTDHQFDSAPLELKSGMVGSLHNAINNGNIVSIGQFHGQSRISGIVSMNYSLLSSVFNTGDIYNENQTKSTTAGGDGYNNGEFEVETAGISFLMIGKFAQIIDSANYGRIVAYALSTAAAGWVNASGISIRNDKLESGTDINNIPQAEKIQAAPHKAKIMFTINYGDVYAWNGYNDNNGTVATEPRTKAAGILALGVLSTINVMNYGDIYSKYLASGMFGFVFSSKFIIGTNETFLANSINYGKIRRIRKNNSDTNHNSPFSYTAGVFQIDGNAVVNGYINKTGIYSYGALIGKVHTGGTSNWNFSETLQNMVFSYLINFDDITDVVGRAPTTTGSNPTLVSKLNQNMATIIRSGVSGRNEDKSPAPFNVIKAYSLNTAALTGNSGRAGTTYGGIFAEDFILRKPPQEFLFPTDKYIFDFIQYLPYDKVNDTLAAKIGLANNAGIYGLASSQGIKNGEFIPDNIEFKALNPVSFGSNQQPVYDETWQGDVANTNSIKYKFSKGMKQIKKSIASTIFDMELVATTNSNLILKNPVIDNSKNTLTYYVASNSNAAAGTSQTGTGYATIRYVPVYAGHPDSKSITNTNRTSSKLVGTHRYNEATGQYEEVGPYHTDGNYEIATAVRGSTGNRYNYRQYAISNAEPSYVYVYQTSTSTSYYNLTLADTQNGRGAYKRLANGTYEYVGPTQYDTYVAEKVPVNMYHSNNLEFRVNTEQEGYELAKNASLYYTYGGTTSMYPGNVTTKIPNFTGIYDYDHITNASGSIIDKASNYHGKIRVYAEAYEPVAGGVATDPYTYTDYTIRIVRLPDETFTSASTVKVNGVTRTPTGNVREYSVSNYPLSYKPSGNNGKFEITYVTNNIPNLKNFLPMAKLYRGGVEYTEYHLYELTGGIVSNTNEYNQQTSSWGTGQVTFHLTVTAELPSGDYELRIILADGNIYKVNIKKQASPEAAVLELHYNGESFINSSSPTTTYTSNIPYSIYYKPSDSATKIVNFNNLFSLTEIPYHQLTEDNIPSYLTDIKISPHATLVKITTSTTISNGIRSYVIGYHIRSESGATETFTHTLTEILLPSDVQNSYKNGNKLEVSSKNQIEYNREESPTIRIDYNFINTYFVTEDQIEIGIQFNGSGNPVENIDYYIQKNIGLGFEITFTQTAPVGIYQFHVSYKQTQQVIIGANPQNITWERVLQLVMITKQKNNNSRITNIAFTSDTIYTGIDTVIMDNALMSFIDYENYKNDRQSRKIIVLQTSGINYKDTSNSKEFAAIGLVRKTNLDYYQPIMTLPVGAMVRRVTDVANVHDPSKQSTDLYTDFNPLTEDEFNYIQYRIYAENYDMNDPIRKTYYTDYFIAVQDVTNNVRFEISVKLDDSISSNLFDKLFITLNNFDETGNLNLSMSLFSYFQGMSKIGTHGKFETTVSGIFQVQIDLPKEYTFELRFVSSSVIINGDYFSVDNEFTYPRKYEFEIIIKPSGLTTDWGSRTETTYSRID